MIFELSPLWGLLPLLLYIILSFRGMDMIWVVLLCVILGGVLTGTSPIAFGNAIAAGLGSFMGLIGFIILIGAGLGEVLVRAGVAPTVVYKVMNSVGIKSQSQAMIATLVTSTVIVALLGTMAGGNAILAPILIPIMATLRIKPATLGVLLHGGGAAGLFVGPFVPPVVATLQLAKVDYLSYIFWAGAPGALIVLVVTFVLCLRLQKQEDDNEYYSDSDMIENSEFTPTPSSQRATAVFLIFMVCALGYGIWAKAGASYVLVVMGLAALIVGWVVGWKPGETLATLIQGGSKMYWLFFLFVLYDPFLYFITKTGAFDAIAVLLNPLINFGGSTMFMISSSIIGIFGVSGAAVAQAKVMNEMFAPMVAQLKFPPHLWAIVLLLGSQMTSFVYPTGDMIGQMGLARSKNLKAMLYTGVCITICTIIYIILVALLYPFAG